MAMEPNFRPYAATANILAVLDRTRNRNLPEAVDSDFLRLSGIPQVVFGRVTQALLFLDLMHEDGRPTDKIQAMAGAGEEEYRALLSDCIRAAYRADFERVDPEKDNQSTIIDAFQRYEPRSQTSRMVMLFLGLCRAAGIPVLDAPRERKMQSKSNGARPGRASTPVTAPRRDAMRGETKVFESRQQQIEALFSVTEEDIAVLKDDEFDAVWAALGTVAKARARRIKEQRTTPAAVELNE